MLDNSSSSSKQRCTQTERDRRPTETETANRKRAAKPIDRKRGKTKEAADYSGLVFTATTNKDKREQKCC